METRRARKGHEIPVEEGVPVLQVFEDLNVTVLHQRMRWHPFNKQRSTPRPKSPKGRPNGRGGVVDAVQNVSHLHEVKFVAPRNRLQSLAVRLDSSKIAPV